MNKYERMRLDDRDYVIEDDTGRVVAHLYYDEQEDGWMCRYYDQDGLLFCTIPILNGDIEDIQHYAINKIIRKYDDVIKCIEDRKEFLKNLDWRELRADEPV